MSFTYSYNIGSVLVTWSSKMKYLGVVITSNLKWNDHCQHIVHRATQSLKQLWRVMYGCTDAAKTSVYLALVRPCLEHCNVVWSIYTSKNIDLIEPVQHRATRWIRSSFSPATLQWSKSSSDCIRELRWPSLKLWHNYIMCIVMHAILNNFTPINFSDYYHLAKWFSNPSHRLTIY